MDASNSALVTKFRLLSRVLSSLIAASGCLVLVGWVFQVSILTSLIPGQRAIPPDAALAFFLLGISLRAMVTRQVPPQLKSETSVYAAAASIIGLFSFLLQIANGSNELRDFLLSMGAKVVPDLALTLMTPNIALEVVLLGLAVVLLQTKASVTHKLGQFFTLIVLVLALIAEVACAYSASSVVGLNYYFVMSLPISILFAALCLSLLFGQSERVLAGILASNGLGGTYARRFFTLTFVAAVGVGWLGTLGLSVRLYGPHLGAALLVVILLLAFSLVIWLLCRSLDRIFFDNMRDREHIQKVEEQHRLTFENLYEAFISVESKGLIVDWNKQAENVLGWTKDEVVGTALFERIIPEEHRDSYYNALRNFVNTGQGTIFNKQIELVVLHHGGHSIPAELSISPIQVNGDVQFCVFLRDISERKRLSEELSRARDMAMEASRLKSEFVANISHEIRTPLNAIVGMSDILLRRQLSDDLREFADTIHDSADSLLNIVNDILDYSRIEAGKLNLEITDFDIVSVVEGSTELIAGKAREKGLSLSAFIAPNVPGFLRGDPGRIRQVLLNLLTNSIKFTESGEVVVRVSLAASQEHNAIVEFSITDTGIGITTDALSRVFEPFTQADGSITRRYGGTGLGLSISKRLVGLMHGQIEATSAPAKGSRFWFTVPLSRSLKRPQITASKQVFQDVKLLIVDGPPNASEIIQTYASSWGIRCETAATGEEALHMMRRESAANAPFDLAIVDFQLTYSDALALAQSVRKYDDIAHTKLILVSTFDDGDLSEDALKAGFSAFLTKPVKQSRLYDCIINLLSAQGEAQDEAIAKSEPNNVTSSTHVNSSSKSFAPGKLVLVVEDNAVNQKVAIMQLSELGYPAHAVSDGKEALESISRTDYALVLMDCQMPEMDGFEATKAIRRKESLTGRHIPIVAMTAHAMPEDRFKCINSGMDDYISKPVKRRRLQEVLERYIQTDDAVLGSKADDNSGETVREDMAVGSSREPIDFHGLFKDFGEAGANELCQTFLCSVDSLFAKLDEGLREHSIALLKASAHELKGASVSFRAVEIVSLSLKLEDALAKENWPLIKELYIRLRAAFERVKSYLSKRPMPNGGRTVPPDITEIGTTAVS